MMTPEVSFPFKSKKIEDILAGNRLLKNILKVSIIHS